MPRVEATRVGRLPKGLFCLYTNVMKPRYLYLSGLGDRLDGARRVMLWCIRLMGRDIGLVPMNWNDTDESYQLKQRRIMMAINEAQGREIVLIGESAGGAMAFRMLFDHPDSVRRIVTICGYNHTAKGINAIHRELHPAFVETVEANDDTKKPISDVRDRALTIYSPNDSVVKPVYSLYESVPSARVKGKMHKLIIVNTVLFHGNLWH